MTGMTATPLHIIEPMLNSEVGHCMSLVRALTQAAADLAVPDVQVWCAKEAAAMPWTCAATRQPHFIRRWRRFQALALYARLLRQPGRLLVSTASSTDLISLDWMARCLGLGVLPRGKVSLFVHWLNVKPGKARWFQSIAQRQPHVQILAPTSTVAQFFSDCGFDAKVVPYPMDQVDAAAPGASADGVPEFRHLLVAGGARMDKGLGHVVDLVRQLQQQHRTWPIAVQTSMEDRHQHDPDLADALKQLQDMACPLLVMHSNTMDRASYRALFDGAVVLQPYSANDFRDRVSGVTLDALSAGAPCVVTAGTWMDQLVSRYQAGVATADLSPLGLIQAIDTIVSDYPAWAARARHASQQVQKAHSANVLMQAVLCHEAIEVNGVDTKAGVA